MTTKVQKWGNSYGIRLPKAAVKKLALRVGSPVKIVGTTRSIRIVPVHSKRETIEEMIARITPENRHKEVDWGPPVGREIW